MKKAKKNHKIDNSKIKQPAEKKPPQKKKTIEYNLNGQIYRSSNISTSMDSLFDIQMTKVNDYVNELENKLAKMQNKINSRINDILLKDLL